MGKQKLDRTFSQTRGRFRADLSRNFPGKFKPRKKKNKRLFGCAGKISD